MTQGLFKAMGLPDIEDVVPAKPAPSPVVREEMTPEAPIDRTTELFNKLIAGSDHGHAMDDMHDETIKHARDIVDLAFNIDPSRARGMFEQAANFFKIAMDSKNSKRDAQLKAMKLMLDHKKFEFEKAQARGEAIDGRSMLRRPWSLPAPIKSNSTSRRKIAARSSRQHRLKIVRNCGTRLGLVLPCRG
jgi:hypothetical protein